MQWLVLGVNHISAPVAIREGLAFSAAQLPEALISCRALAGVNEVVIVSTCNRTELYAYVEGDKLAVLQQWLATFHRSTVTFESQHFYHYRDAEAIQHILRVACGLDSMVLGEPQILGQIKTAYQVAKSQQVIGKALERLLQHTFTVAKQVRTDTEIGSNPVSVAFAAVSLSKQIFSDLKSATALLIGAGDTIELAAKHLRDNQVAKMIIANRTVQRAHDLAQTVSGQAIALSDLPHYLAQADIVISSTASQLPILGKGMVESAIRKRKRRPIFMVDIAVPRDIEPEVGQLEDIYLYCVDDLQDIIEENRQSRRNAAKQAEEMITIQVAHFLAWIRSQEVVPTIQQLRQQAEQHRTEVVLKAKKQLTQGAEPEQVIEQLANQLTNKLLHEPSRQLKQVDAEQEAHLITAARQLFNLKDSM